MQIIGWIGHIRILIPACFLYILSQFGSEALLNHQLLEASALFIKTRSCGQTGFPNHLTRDSTLLFEEGSGASRADERRGMGVLFAVPD